MTNGTAETGTSTQQLTVSFAITNINFNGAKIPFLINDNAAGGYSFQLNNTFAANSPAVFAFVRALRTWTCGTGINWDRSPTDTSTNTNGADGVNVVAFDTAAQLPAGVLGRGFSFYSSCDGTNWGVTEIDVLFDDATNWQFGPALPVSGQDDFESVALHELGHTHQLQHVISPGALMNFQLLSGTAIRTLGANDISAGQFVMARSTVAHACGFASMIARSCTPSAIELTGFEARAYDSGVLLNWRTGREVDNLGFKIYREEGGRRTLLTQQIVAGSALVAGSGVTMTAGRSYSWWDAAADNKKSARYFLEEIDINGQSSLHGPASPNVIKGAPADRSSAYFLSQLARNQSQEETTKVLERYAGTTLQSDAQTSAQAKLAAGQAVKISIKQEDWYRVTSSQLAAAGFDSAADPSLLQLFADGKQLPMRVITDGASQSYAIEFYGVGLDKAETDSRTYWLAARQQPGLRVKEVKSADAATGDRSFLQTVEHKEKSVYFSALRNGDKENFFGAVIAKDVVNQSLTLRNVDQSADEAASLEVALQGVTTASHKVHVDLNGTSIGEVAFDGQSAQAARFPISQSMLKEGANTVTLTPLGTQFDVSLVDYVRVSYRHAFKADNDTLRFIARGGQSITVGGFTNSAIRVIDVTEPDATQELPGKIKNKNKGCAITFAVPEGADRRLLLFTGEQLKEPALLAKNEPSTLRAPEHEADLLIVTRREFFAELQPLALLRQSQGLSVQMVDIEDIYDEFSYGQKSTQAIKDFFLFAKNNWKTPPRFALLAGDASLDPRNYLGFGDSDFVPTKLLDTNFMETASDDWLGDFDGEGISEIAIGRLPARTREEAGRMIAKVIGYERAAASEEMLLLADSKDD